MKAIIYQNYGAPEVLNVAEVKKPEVKEGNVVFQDGSRISDLVELIVQKMTSEWMPSQEKETPRDCFKKAFRGILSARGVILSMGDECETIVIDDDDFEERELLKHFLKMMKRKKEWNSEGKRQNFVLKSLLK